MLPRKTEQKCPTALARGKTQTDKNAFSLQITDRTKIEMIVDQCTSVWLCASISNVNDFTILFILKTVIRRHAIVIHCKTYDLWHHINKVCAPCVIGMNVFVPHKSARQTFLCHATCEEIQSVIRKCVHIHKSQLSLHYENVCASLRFCLSIFCQQGLRTPACETPCWLAPLISSHPFFLSVLSPRASTARKDEKIWLPQLFNAHQMREEWKRSIVSSGEGVCCERHWGCSSVAKGSEDHFRRMMDVRRSSHTVLVCPATAGGRVWLCESFSVCLIQSVDTRDHQTCWHEQR